MLSKCANAQFKSLWHQGKYGARRGDIFINNLEDATAQLEPVAVIISFIFETTGALVAELDIALWHSDPC